MKRLYVRKAWRHCGFGRHLVALCLRDAAEMGYQKMSLETIGFLKQAIGLYKSMGFQETPGPDVSPPDTIIYMEIPLKSPSNCIYTQSSTFDF